MKKHTKIYFNHFKYVLDDVVLCEVCGRRGNDLHHIDCRGMGGSKDKDTITNIMCLCRECHIEYGDKKQHMDFLRECHAKKLKRG